MNPLRSLIHATAGNDVIRRRLRTSPGTRSIVERFVAGETVADAATAAGRLVDDGLSVTFDYLGERTRAERQAEQAVWTYLELLDRLHDEGLSMRAEISLNLPAIGLRLDDGLALDNAWRICTAAEKSGATVTLDVADYSVVEELRRTWPWVGAVLRADEERAGAEGALLAGPDSRVRLSRGRTRPDPAVDLNFVRCANILLAGGGYPMFATHDPRLTAVLGECVRAHGRRQGSYEYQMSYGVRSDEQRRLAAAGETVRVRVPFGEQWPRSLRASISELVSRS
ncbi:MAG TPA: proline dehydrogenase [Amycolatopsis sp.]|nr:proline dehydrogenase [Amycolatopsis sp.]